MPSLTGTASEGCRLRDRGKAERQTPTNLEFHHRRSGKRKPPLTSLEKVSRGHFV